MVCRQRLLELMRPVKSFTIVLKCPDVVVIPEGEFDMGSNDGDADESPVHHLLIKKSFALGRTEVTQLQWRAVMQDQSRSIIGNDPSYFSSCGEDCPVEQVSWNEVKIFIQKLNAKTRKQYRLPSEAEWEYAYRADEKHEYCGGNNLESVAWYGGTADTADHDGKATAHVAGKRANAFGLYDMSGNVWEWVEDSYHDNYRGAPKNARAWQSDDKRRVLRGGSWFNNPRLLRVSNRRKAAPNFRSKFVGFRVLRVLN